MITRTYGPNVNEMQTAKIGPDRAGQVVDLDQFRPALVGGVRGPRRGVIGGRGEAGIS